MDFPSVLFFAQYLLPLCRQADGVLLLIVVAQQRSLRLQLAAQNHLGGGVLNQLLHRAAQRRDIQYILSMKWEHTARTRICPRKGERYVHH